MTKQPNDPIAVLRLTRRAEKVIADLDAAQREYDGLVAKGILRPGSIPLLERRPSDKPKNDEG